MAHTAISPFPVVRAVPPTGGESDVGRRKEGRKISIAAFWDISWAIGSADGSEVGLLTEQQSHRDQQGASVGIGGGGRGTRRM